MMMATLYSFVSWGIMKKSRGPGQVKEVDGQVVWLDGLSIMSVMAGLSSREGQSRSSRRRQLWLSWGVLVLLAALCLHLWSERLTQVSSVIAMFSTMMFPKSSPLKYRWSVVISARARDAMSLEKPKSFFEDHLTITNWKTRFVLSVATDLYRPSSTKICS